MEKKIKKWIEEELNNVKYRNYDVNLAKTRCYGVIMFAINELFDEYNEDLAKWWDDEILPIFMKLERGQM